MSLLEEFHDVKGYEGRYKINKLGKVKSLERKIFTKYGKYLYTTKDRILKNYWYERNEYFEVSLCKNGKKKKKLIHRLLAEHFIPNPNNFELVEHVDGNKKNIKIENLRWKKKEERNFEDSFKYLDKYTIVNPDVIENSKHTLVNPDKIENSKHTCVII